MLLYFLTRKLSVFAEVATHRARFADNELWCKGDLLIASAFTLKAAHQNLSGPPSNFKKRLCHRCQRVIKGLERAKLSE